MIEKSRKEYARIGISEGMDVNKTNALKECNICHYQYFKDIGFIYETNSFMQKATNVNNVTIFFC